MPEPNFFIVGAPKCGTTAMYEYLRQHPDIFMPHVKEMHHFGSDIQMQNPLATRRKERDIYLSYFDQWSGEKRIGEASVFYLASQFAAQEIHDFDPDAKIIIMLRDPASMLYSWYWQLRFTGVETLETFEEALAAESRRKQGMDIPEYTNWVNTLFYTEMVCYTEQVKRYFDVFGQDQVHVILFDDFKSDTETVYRNLLTFLGVQESFVPDFPVVNAHKVIRSRPLQRFFSYPPQWYKSLLGLGRKIVPLSIRNTVNHSIRSFNTIPTKREPMKPETRKQLKKQFRDEIISLANLLERDLSHWYQD